MLLGITQPTFLPWIGYFAFLDKVDTIIFLDDIQFEKRSWQQRNNIKINGQSNLITIPVKTKGKFIQKISDVEILNNKSIELIKKKIFYTYKNAIYFDEYYEDICNIFDKKHNFLLQLNIDFIKFFIKTLNIKINFDFSSNYLTNSKKEKLIFDLCKLSGCDKYLTTVGSKNYLKDLKIIPDTDTKIFYFEYKDVEYTQLDKNFIPKLSILDLLFNEGTNSINILRKGFKLI
jgi:hypothetical protein